MIKADLITGFLGSGKTTFLKRYAGYLMGKGEKIGILENDFGAVNVDVMLLQELERDGCGLETVAGACDRDCHFRRFKTKLIAMAMSGYDRVIIEPSGIFDIDEFFDALHEEPLDRWYEIGSVIAVVDAGLEGDLSDHSRYLLGAQMVSAGVIVLSKTDIVTPEKAAGTIRMLDDTAAECGSGRKPSDYIIAKRPDEMKDEDLQMIAGAGYSGETIVKTFGENSGYGSLYFMNCGKTVDEIKVIAEKLLEDESCGKVFRVKGFVPSAGGWTEINAAAGSMTAEAAEKGQDIIIVIGEQLNKTAVESYFKA